MERLEPEYLNRIFKNAAFSGGDMLKEAQQAGTDFINKKMKELSFHRKVMKPRPVGIDDVLPRTNSDTFYKVIAKDIKDARAYPVAFVGQATDTYFTGPRYELDFHRIFSDTWHKSIDEIDIYAALGVPITKLIEDNMVVALHTVEDTKFIEHCNKIITDFADQEVTSANAIFERVDFINLFKLLTNNKLRVGTLLMAENTLYDVWTWAATDIGSDKAGEILVDGYKYEKLLKYPVITTMKNDLVPDKEDDATVWAFAPVEAIESIPTETEFVGFPSNYLGVAYILKEPQLMIETRKDEIEMFCREIVASGIGNTFGVTRLRKE